GATLGERGVLVAGDLAPGEAADLDPELLRGIATAFGGPTSHGAILARALGVPAVVGAGPELLGVTDGTALLVDGDSGTVQVAPTDDEVATARQRRRVAQQAERAPWGSDAAPAAPRDAPGA